MTGASSGIGDAIARRLAAAGFRVFGASRKAPADPVSGIEHVTIDVDDDSSVRAGVANVRRAFKVEAKGEAQPQGSVT